MEELIARHGAAAPAHRQLIDRYSKRKEEAAKVETRLSMGTFKGRAGHRQFLSITRFTYTADHDPPRAV